MTRTLTDEPYALLVRDADKGGWVAHSLGAEVKTEAAALVSAKARLPKNAVGVVVRLLYDVENKTEVVGVYQ